jgi:hypothetical protein
MGLKRRNKYDPFAFQDRPHRATVWNQYSQPVWERKIPADTDLRKELAALIEYWRGLGWEIEEPYLMQVFMRRGGERWLLFVTQDR